MRSLTQSGIQANELSQVFHRKVLQVNELGTVFWLMVAQVDSLDLSLIGTGIVELFKLANLASWHILSKNNWTSAWSCVCL